VAHEMVHLHIILKKVREGEHGRTFRRLAKLASKTLDCDPGEF
jgi:predicted SprT family Zn-dependent metalloprotease